MAAATVTGAGAETRIKVFVSYSRADKAFASDLVLGLAACGFAPYIDRHDIAPGEDWEKRLEGLISEADSIVYIVSPDSLTSDNCGQEFRQALNLRKRILPVVWRPVDDAAAPPEMKRLNYIFFSGEGRSFAAGLSELAAALRTDIGWIREHTRLAELSGRWASRGRPAGMLLRGDDIDAASDWLAAKPITAPAVTDDQADFIKASTDARVEAERRARRARAGLLTAVSVVAVLMAGLAGLAGVAWMNAAQSEAQATSSRDEAVKARNKFEDASLRLNARVSLRTAPSSTGYYSIGEGWYPVVANFSGSIARIERSGAGQPNTLHGGFMIDGGLVHPDHAGQPLLLAMNVAALMVTPPELSDSSAPPADTLAPNDPRQPQRMILPGEAVEGQGNVRVTFPVLGASANVGGELVWRTPAHLGGEQPFEIWKLSGVLPRGVSFIREKDVDCRPSDALQPGTTVGVYSLGLPAEGGPVTDSVALNISELIDGSDPRNITYSHSTNRATGGSPLFDLNTQTVLAVHYGSSPDPTIAGRRRGEGNSLRLILDMARSSIRDAKLGPLCEPPPLP